MDVPLAALAALTAAISVLPNTVTSDAAGQITYSALVLLVAGLCLHRARNGVPRFRWGWRILAAVAALKAFRPATTLFATAASTGGSHFERYLQRVEPQGIIIAACLLGVLFLEGSPPEGKRQSEERPRLDALMCVLGLWWSLALALPALSEALLGASAAFLAQLGVGVGTILLLANAAERGGVPEVRKSWLWLQAAVAGQALYAALTPPNGVILIELGSMTWVSGMLYLGSLTCLGLAACQPSPSVSYWQARRPWKAEPLSPWIFTAGTGLLAATCLFAEGAETCSPGLLTAAVTAYFVLMPWRMHTGRKRILKRSLELRQESVRLRHLLDSITDAVAAEDLQGTIVFANSAFHRLFGIPPRRGPLPKSEMLIHPHDVDKRRRHLRGCLEDRRSAPRFEYRGRRADGVTLELEAHLKPLELGGIVVGTTSVIRDLARQHLIEKSQRAMSQRLEFFVSEMPLGCVIWDLNFAVQTGTKAPNASLAGRTPKRSIAATPTFLREKKTPWPRRISGISFDKGT